MEDFETMLNNEENFMKQVKEINRVTDPIGEELMKFLESINYNFNFDHPNIHLCISLEPEKYDELMQATSGRSDLPINDYSLWQGPMGIKTYIVKKFK